MAYSGPGAAAGFGGGTGADTRVGSTGSGSARAAVAKRRSPDCPAACAAAGRDPRTLTRSAETLVDTGAGFSVAEVLGRLDRYAALGISHLQVQLRPNSIDGVRAFAPLMEALRRPTG